MLIYNQATLCQDFFFTVNFFRFDSAHGSTATQKNGQILDIVFFLRETLNGLTVGDPPRLRNKYIKAAENLKINYVRKETSR